MRRVVWQMMVSLDGFVQGPNRELDWHVVDEDFARYVADMQNHVDTILFGRVTYQMMAAYWPTSTAPEARMMNELPKIVFSRTLKKVEWHNSRLVKENVAEEVARLKQQPGKDIAMFGSADLAVAYFQFSLPQSFWPVLNGGVVSALYCFVWLYFSAAGGGPWSLDAKRGM